MRQSYSTIKPSVVHQIARSILATTLQFQPYKKSVSLNQLLDLLLLLAATTSTLFAVVRQRFSFSHELGRRAVTANLTTLEVLTKRLNDALYAVAEFSRLDRRRHWTVAIDTHNVPYYGSRSTPHIVGGQKKQGTKYFHSYATAILLHDHRRYTVGLMPVAKGAKPHELVEQLLTQIRSRGLSIGGVVLDSGFDSGETILLLQKLGVSYTVPLRRKGNQSNRRNDCFSRPSGTIETVSWVTKQSRKPVTTQVLVWKRPTEKQTRVFAFSGWGKASLVSQTRRAWLGRRRYRERFGIETSYRQKNQARGWTTSQSAVYRLLLEGLSLILRQVWVRLTEEIARSRSLKPSAWVSELPLVEMLEWLADAIKTPNAHTRCITINSMTLTTTASR
jgi:hypothetical protein